MIPSISSVFFELPGTKAVVAAAENKKDFEMLETLFGCFNCCFKSQSTARVIAGRSVHITTLFPGQA